MFEKNNTVKRFIPAIIVITLVAVGLVLTYVLSNNDSDTEIVLPSPTASVETEQISETPKPDTLLSVSPENVKDVLSTVSRPSSYHRTVEINTISDDSVATQTTEVWVREDSQHFEISDNREKRHVVIADGRVSIWYDGEEGIHSFEENQLFSADDILGIPTYEDVLSLDPSLITSADYVTVNDGDSYLYVEFVSADNRYQYRYWVSLETGLLSEAVTLSDGETVYSMKETYMQLLPATDSEFDNKFLIPEA